jgi:hypothetical protein
VSGYIYALVNPSLPGMVKIGRTDRDPKGRAKELSSATGVPTPFIVAHSIFVEDSRIAENIIHGYLENNGFRVSSNREFFSIPIGSAIQAMEYALGTFSTSEAKGCDEDHFDEIIKYLKLLDGIKSRAEPNFYCPDEIEKGVEYAKKLIEFEDYLNGYFWLAEFTLPIDVGMGINYLKRAIRSKSNDAFGVLYNLFADRDDSSSIEAMFSEALPQVSKISDAYPEGTADLDYDIYDINFCYAVIDHYICYCCYNHDELFAHDQLSAHKNLANVILSSWERYKTFCTGSTMAKQMKKLFDEWDIDMEDLANQLIAKLNADTDSEMA